MNIKTIMQMTLAATLLATATTGCTARGETVDAMTVNEYQQAMARFPGTSSQIDLGLQRFESAFADLTAADRAERFGALYAPELYFNDTLHVLHSADEVVSYLTRTGAALKESHVEIEQVIRDEEDVFIRWTMEFRTRAAGREIHSHSIGMTHLRFDDRGRVVLHQDFWDSGHALYAHLPFVGFAVRQARNRMQ